MKITFTKAQWESMGRQAGWLKKSAGYISYGLEFETSLHGKHYRATLTSPEEFPELEVDSVSLYPAGRNDLMEYIIEMPDFQGLFTTTVNQLKESTPEATNVSVNYHGLQVTFGLSEIDAYDISLATVLNVVLVDDVAFLNSDFVQGIIERENDKMYQEAKETAEASWAEAEIDRRESDEYYRSRGY